MSRFATLAVALCALASIVSSSPVPAALEKREYQGRGTYYAPGLGACGEYSTGSDAVVALSTAMYGSGSHCGQQIQITNTANGVQQSATVLDKCPGCGTDDIDMSPSLFESLGAGLSVGVLQVAWSF